MGAFEYRALDAGGKTQKGWLQGDSARHVRQQLRERGLTPLSVDPTEAAAASRSTRSGRLNGRERALVLRQLATLAKAGIPLADVLGTVAEQSRHGAVRGMLAAMRASVMEGRALAGAMAVFPAAFPNWVTQAVGAGEQAGKLDQVLDRLADYAENRDSLVREIGLTLLYPVVIVIVALLVVIAMMVYVVPRVVRVFDQAGQELPWLTRVLIAVSDALQAHGVLLAVAAAAVVLGGLAAFRLTSFRSAVQSLLLRLPLIGGLVRDMNTARFSRTLSLLVGSGVPLLEALPVAERAMSSEPMRRAAREAAVQVREGVALARALERTGRFPPVTVRLIDSGEQSGGLAPMLERAAASQERDLQTAGQAFMALLQPALILLVGGFVLLIVLAVMLPILNFNQLLA